MCHRRMTASLIVGPGTKAAGMTGGEKREMDSTTKEKEREGDASRLTDTSVNSHGDERMAYGFVVFFFSFLVRFPGQT